MDVLWGTGRIRFKATNFGGDILLHCHKLRHEDAGAMAVIEAVGGCDSQFNDYTSQNADSSAVYQSCDYQTNVIPVCEAIESITAAVASVSPTREPSTNPTKNPTTSSTKKPVFSPTRNSCCIFDGISARRDARCGTKRSMIECISFAQLRCYWIC